MLMLAAISDEDLDRAECFLSRMGYLVYQLRLTPEDRAFYVPLILEFYRLLHGTLPTIEAGNILEVAVARIMRYEYTSASIMLQSLAGRLKVACKRPHIPTYSAGVGLAP